MPISHITCGSNRVDGTVKNFKAHALQIFLVQLDNLIKPFGADSILRLLENPVLFLDDPRTHRASAGAVTLKSLFKRNIKKKKFCTDSVLPAKIQQRLSRHWSYRS